MGVQAYTLQRLKGFIDISTYCNAACPQCHRTDQSTLDKVDWLPLIQWSFEDFKKKFPKNQLHMYEIIEICGTWGDPAMNKDIDKICRYLTRENNIDVLLNTNGSMRDEMWWYQLGIDCGEKLSVEFTVDGIDQEMHSRYRQKTDLDLILSHMEAVSETKAKVRSMTILFKHNAPYKDQIEQLCKDHGAKICKFKISDRFDDGDRFNFKDGQYLERYYDNQM